MKNKIIYIVFLLIFTQLSIGQTFTEETSATDTNFENAATEQNFLLSQNNTQLATLDNNVFITQVGDNNVSNATTVSDESNITIIQNGDDNLSVLDINSEKINQSVLQNGDNNTFLDYSTLRTDLRDATIIQNGDNQNLNIFGSNSLSEKIKVSMQGQSQTVIIRNF